MSKESDKKRLEMIDAASADDDLFGVLDETDTVDNARFMRVFVKGRKPANLFRLCVLHPALESLDPGKYLYVFTEGQEHGVASIQRDGNLKDVGDGKVYPSLSKFAAAHSPWHRSNKDKKRVDSKGHSKGAPTPNGWDRVMVPVGMDHVTIHEYLRDNWYLMNMQPEDLLDKDKVDAAIKALSDGTDPGRLAETTENEQEN